MARIHVFCLSPNGTVHTSRQICCCRCRVPRMAQRTSAALPANAVQTATTLPTHDVFLCHCGENAVIKDQLDMLRKKLYLLYESRNRAFLDEDSLQTGRLAPEITRQLRSAMIGKL